MPNLHKAPTQRRCFHITSHYNGMGRGGCVKVQEKEKNIKAQLKMICEVSVPQSSLLRSHLPDIS